MICRHKWTVIRTDFSNFNQLEGDIKKSVMKRCARCFEVWVEGRDIEPRVVVGTLELE